MRGEAALNELVALLPGSYDNIAQARTCPDHSSLRLVIAPVQAPLVGDHVFYMQEMAGDDPRRVLSQRLYVRQLQCRTASSPPWRSWISPNRRAGATGSSIATCSAACSPRPASARRLRPAVEAVGHRVQRHQQSADSVAAPRARPARP